LSNFSIIQPTKPEEPERKSDEKMEQLSNKFFVKKNNKTPSE
jgi:hypothetical protein